GIVMPSTATGSARRSHSRASLRVAQQVRAMRHAAASKPAAEAAASISNFAPTVSSVCGGSVRTYAGTTRAKTNAAANADGSTRRAKRKRARASAAQREERDLTARQTNSARAEA